MATISSNPIAQPHLVSLVLQSKKALQHGEQLCTRAHVASNASAQAAVDVLALDAKVRWISEAVIEQLKVSSVVTDMLTAQNYFLCVFGMVSWLLVWRRASKRNARIWARKSKYVLFSDA
jgi:hypothetical protein